MHFIFFIKYCIIIHIYGKYTYDVLVRKYPEAY